MPLPYWPSAAAIEFNPIPVYAHLIQEFLGFTRDEQLAEQVDDDEPPLPDSARRQAKTWTYHLRFSVTPCGGRISLPFGRARRAWCAWCAAQRLALDREAATADTVRHNEDRQE